MKQFEVIESINNNNNDITMKLLNYLNEMIISQTLLKFSNYLENVCEHEKRVILNNENEICQYLKDSKWNKGLNLFKLVISQWNEQNNYF